MSGALSKLETRIANLEKASEELREQTREANATLKQLRLVKKEVAELLDSTPQKLVTEAITEAVNEGLAKFRDELREHTTRSHKAVEREFDHRGRSDLVGRSRHRAAPFGSRAE